MKGEQKMKKNGKHTIESAMQKLWEKSIVFVGKEGFFISEKMSSIGNSSWGAIDFLRRNGFNFWVVNKKGAKDLKETRWLRIHEAA